MFLSREAELPFKEIINYISHQKYLKRKFDGTHIPKKEILMAAYVTQKPFWNQKNFFKFDSLYKQVIIHLRGCGHRPQLF